MPAHSLLSDTPTNLEQYCSGLAADEAYDGFQAALDDLPAESGQLVSPPGKIYRVSTPLVCTGKSDVQINLNGSWIESRISSGVVLTITDSDRARIDRPRFRLMAGAPSAFIYFTSGLTNLGSWWSTVYEPVIWYHINAPAAMDGIVVDDDNYWVEIVRPQLRTLSGTLTGTFRRGVSFLSQSNACKVLGGSINSCDTGVHIDSSNASEVGGTAFEGCTRAVWLGDSTSPCMGTEIHHIRIEDCPIAVDLSGHTARTTLHSPIQIGDIANQDGAGDASRAREIWNPNNVPIVRKTGEYISLDSSWANMRTGIKVKAADAQGLRPLIELEQRDLSNPVTSLTADLTVGGTTLNVVSTSLPFAFAASGSLLLDGVTSADLDIRSYELVTYTGITGTTFTGVTRAQGGTAAQTHAEGTLVRASFNRTFAIDLNGVPAMRSAAASPPTPVDDRLILHHRAFISRIISWRPDTAGGNIILNVTGAGPALVDVMSLFAASVRPGADGTIDLGLIGTRWRNLYVSAQVNTGFQTLATDAIFTLTPVSSPQNTYHTGTLTANRAVTLSTSGAQAGMVFRISRAGAGAFTLNIGTGPLKALSTGQWCEVIYDGSAWQLFEFGSL